MPLRYTPNISFDSQANHKFTEDINQSIAAVDFKLNDIEKRVETLRQKFEDLQSLADDVAERYEKTWRKHGGRNIYGIDRKSLFQPILDHNLNGEDIVLLCRYIKCIFSIILKLVRRKVPKSKNVKSIIHLHRERTENRELHRAYDDVAKYLQINNSGKPETFITLLHMFLTDNRNGRPIASRGRHAPPSDHTSPQMPINEKLSSRLLVDYALSRVAEQVQDVKLATALKSCVYTVYNVYAANV